MKIKEITSQHRRDFSAIYECEGCGNKESSGGYDDSYFHAKVVPAMKCGKCGKSRNDLGVASESTPTKYADSEVV